MKRSMLFSISLVFVVSVYTQNLEKAFGYFESGQFALAAEEFELVLPEAKKHFGENHFNYANLLTYAAMAFERSQEFPKAEEYYLQAKAIYEITGRTNEANYYERFLINLASLYTQMGHYDKALPLYHEIIENLKKLVGKDHSSYGHCLSYMANFYYQTKDFEKAIQLYHETLENIDLNFGSENITYASALSGLALSYWGEKNYGDAENMLLFTLEILEKIYGNDHPEYLLNSKYLDDLYEEVSQVDILLALNLEKLEKAFDLFEERNYREAAERFEELLPFFLKYFGENDTVYYSFIQTQADIATKHISLPEKAESSYLKEESYGVVLNNLTAYYWLSGQNEKALDYFFKLLDHTEARLGRKHPEYLSFQIDFMEFFFAEISQNIFELASLYYSRGMLDDAIYILQEILKNLEKRSAEDHVDYTMAQKTLGDLFQEKGEFEISLKYYSEAFHKIENHFEKTHPGYLSLINNLAMVYHKTGDYNQSLVLLLELLNIIENTSGKNHENYGPLLNNIAGIYSIKALYEKALEYYLEALAIARNELGKDHPAIGTYLNNIAVLYRTIGHYEKAMDLYLEALGITERTLGKENNDYSTLLNNLGLLYNELGYHDKALLLFTESLEITEKLLGKSHPDYALSLNNLSLLYHQTGQFDKAHTLYLESIKITEKTLGKTHPDYGSRLNNLAGLYNDYGQFDKALPLYMESLEIAENTFGTEHISYGDKLNNLAGILLEKGQHENALSLYLESLRITRSLLGESHPEYATALNNLAVVYQRMGQRDKALPFFVEAFDITEKKLGKKHEYYGRSLENLANLYFQLTLFDKSLPLLYEAIQNRFSNINSSFAYMSESEKGNYIETTYSSFDAYNSIFSKISDKRPEVGEKAFDIALAIKGMILQSGINMRKGILDSESPEALKKFDDWFALRSILAREYSLPLQERRIDLIDIEKNAEALEIELTRVSNTFLEISNLGKTRWQEIQRKLKVNEAALEFISFDYWNGTDWTDSILYAAVVLRKNDKHPHFVTLFEQKQLDSLLVRIGRSDAAFVSGLYRGAAFISSSIPSNGEMLYSLIWEPLEKFLPEGGKIYFSPAGRLHQIAHAAIPFDENSLLSDHYELVQLSTTAVLNQERSVQEDTPADLVLFGGINFDADKNELLAIAGKSHSPDLLAYHRSLPVNLQRGGEYWSELPGTLKEVEEIKQLAAQKGINTISFTGSYALEDYFKNLTGPGSPSIIHIATHGFFFPDPHKKKREFGLITHNQDNLIFKASDNPLNRSGLLLAGANRTWQGESPPLGLEDGILTAWESSNMNLPNTQLVVLSACETGLGDIKGSEGVFGLQRAFKSAGADYLLMSLWKVPDHETAEFMTQFYSYLFSGKTISEAFQDTQKSMKSRYPDDPFSWAAFVLVR